MPEKTKISLVETTVFAVNSVNSLHHVYLLNLVITLVNILSSKMTTGGAAFLLSTTLFIISYYAGLLHPILFTPPPHLLRLSTIFVACFSSFFPRGSIPLPYHCFESYRLTCPYHVKRFSSLVSFFTSIRHLISAITTLYPCPSLPSRTLSPAVHICCKDSPSVRFI